MADLWAFKTCVGLLLRGWIKGFDVLLHLLNVYGPYSHRIYLWDNVKSYGLLSLPNLFLGGDLNFTWSAKEVWGSGRVVDPLSGYFQHLF